MKKYRKKPIVIEAMQLTRRYADVVIEWIPNEILGVYNLGEFHEDYCYLEIETLEGTMQANEGDYIIKGIEGDFYPCRQSVFESTYEEVL